MKKKFKLIAPSMLVIIVCLLLMVGSTFAIFTSQAEASISVTSGKVKLDATLTTLQAYSAEAVDNYTGVDTDLQAGEATAFGVTSKYKYTSLTAVENTNNTQYEFTTGGTAQLTDDKTLILNKVVPGDRVTLNLKLTNSSNVDVKYRVRLNAIEDNGLLDGLKVKVNGTELVGTIKNTAWLPLAANGTIDDMLLEVLLPITAGNEYQEKTAKLRFTVEMVQGNAKVDEVLDLVNGYLTSLGNTNKTMWDAIQDANAWLNTEAGQGKSFTATNYVWNMDTDQFYAEDNVVTGEGFEGRFFKAYTEALMPALANQTFGIYATGAWENPVNVVVGFDAGDATGISSVSYVRNGENDKAQEVVIRTNSASTTLTINAARDTVKHYGAVGSLNIIAVAGSSYHEFGQVAFAEIATGRIVLESESKVEHIHLNTSVVNNNNNEDEVVFNNITVAKAESVEMPDFSRDPVEIPEEGKLVVALQSSTNVDAEKDYVWLTAIGIYEQVTVSNSNTEAGNNYAAEITSTEQKATEQKTAAQQIANNISATVGENEYTLTATPVVENNVVTGWTYALESEEVADITENVTVAVVETVTTVSVSGVEQETVKENGMTTEEKNDFQETLVENAVDSEIVENNENYIARIGNTFYEDIHKAFEALQAGETLRLLKDYRVEQDSIIHVKTSYNEADTAFGNLSADKIFDGCNHTIEFADGVSAYLFGDMNGTIQNFRVLNSTKSIARISKTDASNHPITFKNIEVCGDMHVNGNVGAFVVYIKGENGEFRFIDCVNNCNMTGIGTSKDYNAAFIGYFWGIYGCEVYLTRCINNADIVCGAAAFIGGNPWLNDANKTTPRVYLTDCENRGKIQRTYTGADSFTQNILYGAPQGWLNFSTIIDGRTYSPSDIVNGLVPDTAIRGNKLIIGPVDSTLSLTRNNDGTFSFHGLDGAAKYEVSVGLYVRTVSGTYRYYAKQVINHIENQMDYDANIKDLQFVDYDWLHDHDGAIVSISQWNQEVKVVIYNEQQYFLVPEEYKINGGVTSGQMYTVVAYDSNNNLLASATLEN